MSEHQDSGDKSEQPSQHKLSKARREGQVPRAKEFVSSVTLISVVAYYVLNIDMIKQTFIELFLVSFQFDTQTISHWMTSVELLGTALFPW